MPGERITQATRSIQDYLVYARAFDRKFPGFETDIHGLRFAAGEWAAIPGGLHRQGGRPVIPRDVKAPTVAIPFHKLLKVVAIVQSNNRQTRELLDQIAAQGFEVEVGDNFARDVSEDAAVGAYIGSVEGGAVEDARAFVRAVRGLVSARRSGRSPTRAASRTSRCSR